ncbi:hypothetical protein GQ53DRAFT_345214 [Thozetella sp. PMI_491]|nr:hypothetical protein GQ53DRAFT_345214 [Thozetella sp. PMI_491]
MYLLISLRRVHQQSLNTTKSFGGCFDRKLTRFAPRFGPPTSFRCSCLLFILPLQSTQGSRPCRTIEARKPSVPQ